MKSAKWILRVLAASAFLAVHVHAASQTVDGRTWAYSVVGGTAKVTGVNQASGAVVIPSSLGGYPVTSIGTNAFFNSSGMTSVVIPESVTNIDDLAFQKCSGLTSVTIPKKVARIGTTAFAMCTFLRSIKVASGNANFESKDGVLFNKGKTKLCCCPAGKDDGYSIPGSVTEIGETSFMYCDNLTSLVIPDSVKTIGGMAFYSCRGLASVHLGSGLSTVADGVFRKCYSLKSVAIPASVASIGNGVFDRCDGLNTLYAPESWESKYVDGIFWSSYVAVPTGCTVVYSHLELASSSRTFTADAAGGKEVGVTANVPWTAKSSASWLTVKTASGTGNGTVSYNVAANAGTAPRTGKITVSGSGYARTFTVTQSGKDVTLTLGASSRTFTADAANGKEFEVAGNVTWTAKSSASWLAVKTASGSGNGRIAYNVAANTGTGSRTGTITVEGCGVKRTFTVTQLGKGMKAA